MQFPSILASKRSHPRNAVPALVFSAVIAFAAMLSQQPAAAQSNTNDDVLIQMKQAFQRGDKARLTALLPQARGHALEPWAAYWELKARLQEAAPNEVQDFYARYPGTYQEDRLRNDWLLLTGQRRDWDNFSASLDGFRMGDDPQVRCYAILVDTLRTDTATITLPLPFSASRAFWRMFTKICERCCRRMSNGGRCGAYRRSTRTPVSTAAGNVSSTARFTSSTKSNFSTCPSLNCA